MSHTTTTATAAAPRRSTAQWAIVAVLAILGILALVVAILFITGTANSIHFLSGSVHHGHHQVRLTVSIVAAVLLLAAAGYFVKTTSKLGSVRPLPRHLHGAGAVTVTPLGASNRVNSRAGAR